MSDPSVVEETIQAAARLLMRSALNTLYADPHQWSTRPCPTCRAISGLIGEPFGCNKFAERQPPKRQL